MNYVFPLLGFICLLLGAFFAYKSRHDTSKFISFILVGIFFSTVFMVLSTEWFKPDKEVTSTAAYSFISSILYSLKTLGGRQDIAQLESLALTLPAILRHIYISINYISFFLAPILTSSLLLSFFGDFGEKMRFMFKLTKKCNIISELNDNSLALAKGIIKNNKKETIVFCNTKNCDKSLIAKAKELGAVVFHKPCQSFMCGILFKNYEFFIISSNEDDNIQAAEVLIEKHRNTNRRVTVTAFIESGANICVLEQFAEKSECFVFEELTEETLNCAISKSDNAGSLNVIFCNTKSADENLLTKAFEHGFSLHKSEFEKVKPYPEFAGCKFSLYNDGEFKEVFVQNNRFTNDWTESLFRIRFIDEIALFCDSLIYEYPLYNLPDGRKDISVMIVGCGRLGMRMLKTAVWAGQIKNHTLKIRVYDKKAAKVKRELLKQCPELTHYDIEFIGVDVETSNFKKKMADSLDATYVTVATGSDELNVLTAEYLYRVFTRHNDFKYTPPIFTRVRTNVKSSNFNKNGSFLDKRNIKLFGTAESIFAESTVFNSKIEDLGFAVHLSYSTKYFEAKPDIITYKKELSNYRSCEYNRRSSMSSALHIAAKLYSYGLLDKANGKPTDESAVKFRELIATDESIITELCELEHERWNAFMRSEGYQVADIETVKKYSVYNGKSHKNEAAKLHPCLVEWDELDKLSEQCNNANLYKNNFNFKEIDKDIVVSIPDIIFYANSLSE